MIIKLSIFLLFVILLLPMTIVSCRKIDNHPTAVIQRQEEERIRRAAEIDINGITFQIIEIDNCEYIYRRNPGAYHTSYVLTHKGNCRNCQ